MSGEPYGGFFGACGGVVGFWDYIHVQPAYETQSKPLHCKAAPLHDAAFVCKCLEGLVGQCSLCGRLMFEEGLPGAPWWPVWRSVIDLWGVVGPHVVAAPWHIGRLLFVSGEPHSGFLGVIAAS